MIQVRRSEERGRARRPWLESYFSFSFGEYQDPRHVQVGPLRVLNDDLIAPGGGFLTHSHRDAEVITYVLKGAVEHKDSEGNHGIIRPFEIQRMRAGSGISHSEFNASASEPVHLLQVWILPDRRGIPPGYAARTFDPAARHGRFLPVITPDGREGTVDIAQDAAMLVSHLEPGERAAYSLRDGRQAYLHVATGDVEVGDLTLKCGDGATVRDEQAVTVQADEPSELLLFDLPGE
ncbi:MAG: pirin family protein [Armatimonadetes bacterium]|nr:pirin family protein [Armatimonadota bacterium]